MTPKIADIQKSVAAVFGVTVCKLKGTARSQSIFRPRAAAMYLSYDMAGSNYSKIGRCFGGRDHTSVINAVDRASYLIENDAAYAKQVRIARQMAFENATPDYRTREELEEENERLRLENTALRERLEKISRVVRGI